MTRVIMIAAALAAGLAACSRDAAPGYHIVGDTISAPLSQETASAERGAETFAKREGAHCILCHQHAAIDVPFQGNLGPDLTDVGARLSAAQLRLRIADYDHLKPGTTMPSYFRTHDLQQVGSDYVDHTVLSALEIEDLIAFLESDGKPPPHD